MNEPKANLFYSYSHKDESLRDALESTSLNQQNW